MSAYDITYVLKKLPEIREALLHADPNELETGHANPYTGDCGNIACALSNILGGDNEWYALYRVYHDPETNEEASEVVHVLLKIGDKLIDFGGERTPEDVLHQFKEQHSTYPSRDKFVVKPMASEDIENALDYLYSPERAEAIERVMRRVLKGTNMRRH